MKIQSVTIPVGNEKLSALLYVPEVSNNLKLPSVVILHGRGSSKKRYADRGEALAKKGILTLIFDFRGCGESDGDFGKQTIEMGFEDATAGYEFLKNHPLCDNARIGVLGGSFGGYQAALLAGTYLILSLVLAAPAIYQDDWWNIVPESMDPGKKELYRKQSGFEGTKSMNAISKYNGKILVMEHEKDEIVPHRVTEAYYQNALSAQLKEKKIIVNAPHALYDKTYVDQSINIVCDWFAKTL